MDYLNFKKEYYKNIQTYLEHAGWDEKEHPRGKDGRFISSGASDIKSTKTATNYASASNIDKKIIDEAQQKAMDKHIESEAKRRRQMISIGKGDDFKYKPMSEDELLEATNKELEEYTKTKKDEALRGSEEVISGVSKASNQLAAMLPSGNGKSIHPDYSDISDDELRKQINRLNMEEQYARLKGENKYVKSGSEKAREILQTIGAVGGLILTGLAIAEGASRIGKKNKQG